MAEEPDRHMDRNAARRVPIRDSYWVDPGRLLAAQYPGTFDARRAKARIEAFVTAGIRTFVDLTDADDWLTPYESVLDDVAREVPYASP
jgi:hypothetical protein